MSIPTDINAILDINEEMETEDVDMDLCDSGFILDVADGTRAEGSTETGRKKTYSLPVEEYVKRIKDLEKAGLSYIRLLFSKSLTIFSIQKLLRFRAIELEILVFALEYYNIPSLPDPEVSQNIQMLRDGLIT
ncbi:106_t:CDS:2 [Rhizophagus irregularis]|nr:106_t:CDS:2 [Rhizophagus irregularis]